MIVRAARSAWPFLALLAYALLALGSGCDRLAIDHPALERIVPAPFRVEAAHRATLLAIERRNSVAAVALARVGIAATPVDGRAVGYFLAAHALDNNSDEVARALPVSRMGGLREPLSLALRVEQALKHGQVALAARELEALLRTDPQFPRVDALLVSQLADKRGRRAFARRLESSPDWAAALIARENRNNPGIDPALAGLLRDRGAFAGPLGCAAVRPLVERQLAGADRRAATAIWHGHCPDAHQNGLIVDAHFRSLASADAADPFGWRRIASGDVTLSIGQRNGRATLQAGNSAAVPRKLIGQPVDLAPGRYAITVAPTAGHFEVLLHCAGDADRTAAQRRSADGMLTVTPGCTGQTLTVWIAPNVSNARLDGVEMRSVG